MLSAKVMEAKTWRNSLSERDRDYMNQVLEKLPEDSRIVIYLHYWLDIELKDIAEVLGTKLSEVEFIHNLTLRLLSKVFRQKLNATKCQLTEVAA